MARLNVQYDLLTWEGDILRLQFWNKAFERLKAQGTVYFQDSGRLNGCWVMRIEDGVEHASREARAADLPAEGADGESGEEDQAEKVIVRSNGTVTYVGKDMAYQFWKFGLLGEDFHYRLFGEEGKDGPLWATSSLPTPEEAAERPVFGEGPLGLQRDRRAAVVPAAPAVAGARGGRASGRGRTVDPLLVRDGGAVAPDRETARLLIRGRGRRAAVRRGVRAARASA